MTGHAIALVPCYVHGGVFECDPSAVCATYVRRAGPGEETPEGDDVGCDRDDPGARQVFICDPCMISVNGIRAALGDEPVELAADYSRRLGEWPAR